MSCGIALFSYASLPKRKHSSKLVELEMTRLSAALRLKPFWWTKCRDKTILAKWRAEALEQAKLMKESHVDYVLKELDGYANMRDGKSGAEVRSMNLFTLFSKDEPEQTCRSRATTVSGSRTR